jgi:thiol-disulfide isomerase/thioredoxin
MSFNDDTPLQNENAHINDAEGVVDDQNQIEEPKPINPYSYIPVMETFVSLIGEDIVDSKGEKVTNVQDEVYSCLLLGIFFSGSWASPCRIFEKDLINIYNEVNEGVKNLEIIEVPFDKTEEAYKKSISNKPWKFLPFNSPNIKVLIEKYNVLTIPQFFPVDRKGEIISENARIELINGGADVCEEWINYLSEVTKKEIEEKENEGGNQGTEEKKEEQEQ